MNVPVAIVPALVVLLAQLGCSRDRATSTEDLPIIREQAPRADPAPETAPPSGAPTHPRPPDPSREMRFDLAACAPASLHATFGMGSASVKVLGREGDLCAFELFHEIEGGGTRATCSVEARGEAVIMASTAWQYGLEHKCLAREHTSLMAERTVSALPELAAAGDRASVERLVREGTDVNAVGLDGQSALLAGAGAGHAEIVTLLLAAGADRTIAVEGMTAACEALLAGHDAIAQQIQGALPDDACVPRAKLLRAAAAGDEKVVASLAGRVDDDARRAALVAAAYADREAAVDALTGAGARPGDRLLVKTIGGGHGRAALALLRGGAAARALAGDRAPLELAAERGMDDLLAPLVKAGAAIDAANELPDGRSGAQKTPLMTAAAMGHTSTVVALLRLGADPNVVNAWGETALVCACQSGHVAAVEALLAARADVRRSVYKGEPLLAWARSHCPKEAVAPIEKAAR